MLIKEYSQNVKSGLRLSVAMRRLYIYITIPMNNQFILLFFFIILVEFLPTFTSILDLRVFNNEQRKYNET